MSHQNVEANIEKHNDNVYHHSNCSHELEGIDRTIGVSLVIGNLLSNWDMCIFLILLHLRSRRLTMQFFISAGFLFMLLIDQLASSFFNGGSHQTVQCSDIESGSSPKTSPRRSRTVSSTHSHGVTWTTTLGLLVHAAADGIAMGKHNLVKIRGLLYKRGPVGSTV